jgi:hypothetical protein
MKHLRPVRLGAWAAPLFIAAVAVPVLAGFALGGPGLGLALGALSAAAVIVMAARARFDEPIEVARAPRDRYRVLLVALADVDDPDVAGSVAAAAAEGAHATGIEDQPPEILVLAPALNRKVAHWLSDLDEARFEAQRRLAVSVATLTAAGADARGRVGDSEPLQATEDALRTYPAQEVTFVTGPDESEDQRRLLGEVRRRLDRPVRSVPVPSHPKG